MKSLTIRLLVFNILLIFIPIVSLLFLDTYEKQLLATLEKSLVQQGRIFSSALQGVDLETESQAILHKLNRRLDARIRVVDTKGRLLADSAVDLQKERTVADLDLGLSIYYRTMQRIDPEESIRESLLYQIAVWPARQFRKLVTPPSPPYSSGEFYSGRSVLNGPEISAALEGRYGATTRISTGGQISVNLYSAIPIFNAEQTVIGVVLVNQSTYKILENLYQIRLDIIKIFLISLSVSVALSIILSQTITIPVKKLRNEAEKVLDHGGKLQGQIHALKRGDEIGDLSRSLNTLSNRLEQKIQFIDSFISDVLHEVKNPLTAIRAAAEITAEESPEKLIPFTRTIQNESGRIERLLNGLREITKINTHLEEESTENVDMIEFLQNFKKHMQQIHGTVPALELALPEEPVIIQINPDRLMQICTNLTENAYSFTQRDGKLSISLTVSKKNMELAFCDTGPGISEGNLSRVFDRFFSDRNDKKGHSGLGLAIVKAITEGYGGSVSAINRPETGACFKVNIPLELSI